MDHACGAGGECDSWFVSQCDNEKAMRHPMTKPMKPIHIAILLLFACDARYSFAADETRPNIVLLFADDVGREVLGCYGGTSYETPHLDALAAGGMKFSHCYSMPLCHPSRVCLLTGRYPSQLGFPAWGRFPNAEITPTGASILKQTGYATAVAGKWQLAYLKNNPTHPNQLGFDRSCVFGWHEGARYHDPMIYQDGEVRDDTAGRYGPDLYVEFLREFMRTSVATEQPFFAFYPMALCHNVTDDLGDDHAAYYKDKRWMTFAEMAASMDEMVGRIVKSVDDLGIRERTLIIFTSDNGTVSFTYQTVDSDGMMKKIPVISQFDARKIRGGKGSFTDWGTRVPLIANWPGRIRPGTEADDLVDLSDFLPTLIELADANPGNDLKLDGHSFAARLLAGKPTSRKWVCSELREMRFVRTREFKLYENGRFFDLRKDPEEKTALSLQESIDPKSDKTRSLLQSALSSIPRQTTTKP